MLLGTLFGFIYALRVRETYARVINWTMVAAVGVTFITIPQVIIDGYYLFALTQLGVVVYGASRTDFSSFKKGVLIGYGLLAVVPAGILLAQAPYYLEVSMIAAVIQLSTFIYMLKTDIQSFREEMGFLIILSADALARLAGGFLFFAAN